MSSTNNWILKFWHWLLKRARLHPLLTGFLIFVGLGIISLAVGISTILFKPQTWFTWFNNASVLMGWLSMTAAWSFALLAWAHGKEAKHTFKGAGIEVIHIQKSFDASLILVSLNCQTEWHLRHIQPERVELLWTPMVKEQTENLLKKFPNIKCIDSRPERDRKLTNEQAYEIAVIKQHCISLLKNLLNEHKKERICVDVTAGTAIMNIAAFQAAEEMEVTTIYLLGKSSNKYQARIIDNNKVDDPDEARVIILSDRRESK